ncbi:TRAP transporter small permease [Bacillus haynesii]|uniref:TRAP transporter small permease n=1 Tax=Bacillus haynesii TaxID=1925021 RepID=UPI0022821C77|nr:TRAP transporter small permease [Bacillus haynesii]MCY7850085.1 TRAP transporter small permease [Bacillus haynesii]MCY7915711.1 TRAP transporter small permease [Bacillus haynesii]MCY7925543.1 TRAP transporter small permease [Bacillus haynesii]MCY8006669.1 TRAP transporter small permease [Bacillus haynesii]MCY8342886.1 TRAP transporter small permease [Bacillus haynesii]
MLALKKAVNKTIECLTCTLMAIMVLVAIWQVFTRYILNSPSTFSEEFLRYSLIWISMLGGAYAFWKKKHLAIEFIVRKLPIKAAVFVHTFIQILLIAFALIVLVLGGSKAVITTMEQSSAALGIPVGFVYLSLPVAGILIIGYSLAGLYESLHEFNSKQKSDDDVKKAAKM